MRHLDLWPVAYLTAEIDHRRAVSECQCPNERDLDGRRIELACELLERIQGMSFLVPAVRHHRERFDGAGYPDALAGEDIPLEARVISVANDFDLLIEGSAAAGHDLPTTEAVAQLTNRDQNAYDPRVLEGLLQGFGGHIGAETIKDGAERDKSRLQKHQL